MGRPRRASNIVVHQVKLWLVPGQDDDLIEFFAGLTEGGKAAAVKSAMRSGNIASYENSEDDDMEALLDQFVL